MTRVLLVDDEPLALRRLIAVVGEMSDVEVVGTASDGESAVAQARRLKPDILVLDIEMPVLNGIEVASILATESRSQVIVVSAFARYATDAFAIEATDYVLKPLRPDRLRQAIERAQRRIAEIAALATTDQEPAGVLPSLHIPDARGGRDVALVDVKWIEAARDYVIVHTATQSHLVRSTMTEMADQLPAAIPRVHRSAFVNLDHVERWVRSEKGVYRLVLTDGESVQVGPSYLPELRTMLRDSKSLRLASRTPQQLNKEKQ